MSRPRGRLVALDLGEVRVGVAVSDPLGLTASPAGWFPRRGGARDLESVRRLVAEHEAVGVVVGHPLLLSGVEGDKAKESEAFAERLRAGIEVPVVLWDERLTTVQAERAMIEGGVRREKRRGAVDAVAAAILLQSYLDAAGSSST